MGNYGNDEDRNGVVLEEEGGLGERVTEWEKGLPTDEDVTPLCQALIPPELASAFSILPEPYKTLLDVSRATQTTLSTLRGGATVQLDDSFNEDLIGEEEEEEEAAEEQDEEEDRGNNKLRRMDSVESEGAAAAEGEKGEGAGCKRPRLVWTPQLHKRFVDVVAHLGIKNAVPKTIMQLMNVEGLTRENVASHLQKYRLYLKRQGGGGHSETHPSQSNNSASTSTSQVPPVNGDVGNGGVPYHHQPVSFHHHHHPGVGQGGMVMPMPVPMPMPMYGHMGSHHGNSGNHHPHYHQQQQHQFNGYHSSSNQNGFDVSFGYNYSHHPHRVAPSGDT